MNSAEKKTTLPKNVIARWAAEDWDDEKMVATAYTYENADTGEQIELSDEESARYAWGSCSDDLTGGSQSGELRD